MIRGCGGFGLDPVRDGSDRVWYFLGVDKIISGGYIGCVYFEFLFMIWQNRRIGFEGY